MVAVTSRVVPSAPVPREAAAESSFPGQDLVGAGSFWQAAQSAHWGFEASAGPSHVPTGQLARHGSTSPNRPSEPPPVPTPLPLGGDGTDAPGMRGGGAQSPSPSHPDPEPEPEPEPEHEIRPLVVVEKIE